MEKADISPLVELGTTDSVRNLVINFLSQEWPLNVRRLYTKVEQKRPGISYHAVHKAVHQLLDQGILKREKAGYLLNKEWIEQVHTLVHDMKSRYHPDTAARLPSLKDFKEGESQTFVFDNLADADAYRKKLQHDYGMTSVDKKPYVSMSAHLRSPLVYSERSLALAALAFRSGIPCYHLVAGDTVPDQWCADYYRMQQQFVKTGIPCAETCETMVLGDVIVQFYLPPELKQRTETMYAAVKDTSELSIPDFYRQLYLSKAEVRLTVLRNSDIAEKIRQQVMSHYTNDGAAIFDLDGTFIDPKFPIEATKKLREWGMFNPKSGESLVELCEEYDSGKISRDEFVNEYMKVYGQAVKGKAFDDVKAAINKFVVENGGKFIFESSSRIFSLLRSYRKAVAITRLPMAFVMALEPLFIFDKIISTTMKLEDGKYTGGVEQNLCLPGAKDKAFEAWLRESKQAVEGSIGFGDRFHDIAFLKWVQNPIIINPDGKLTAFAKRKGWHIYGSDNPEKLLARLRALVKSK